MEPAVTPSPIDLRLMAFRDVNDGFVIGVAVNIPGIVDSIAAMVAAGWIITVGPPAPIARLDNTICTTYRLTQAGRALLPAASVPIHLAARHYEE
jgi:hypothetical protein